MPALVVHPRGSEMISKRCLSHAAYVLTLYRNGIYCDKKPGAVTPVSLSCGVSVGIGVDAMHDALLRRRQRLACLMPWVDSRKRAQLGLWGSCPAGSRSWMSGVWNLDGLTASQDAAPDPTGVCPFSSGTWQDRPEVVGPASLGLRHVVSNIPLSGAGACGARIWIKITPKDRTPEQPLTTGERSSACKSR
jgi:hypothetical protein